MEKFSTHISQAIPLNIANVDTDQIIPARFLKATDKKALAIMFFEIGVLINSEIQFQISHLTLLYTLEAF